MDKLLINPFTREAIVVNDCGTGSGGFKAGNSCAKGSGVSEQARAKVGGEIGPNGEFYKGGAFIATTELPKKLRDRLKTTSKGTVEVASGVREQPQPGQMAIYDKLRPGIYFNPRSNQFMTEAQPWGQLSNTERADYEGLLTKFKSGEKWIKVNEYPQFASFKDVALLYVSGQPIPGAAVDKLPTDYREKLHKWQSGKSL